jgi:hypothetical protein
MMTNRKRIKIARDAVAIKTAQDNQSPEELLPGDHQNALSDLLADLQHYAERHELDFDEAVNQAKGHFDHERRFGLDEVPF